jgi:hypothetical protein
MTRTFGTRIVEAAIFGARQIAWNDPFPNGLTSQIVGETP